MALKIYVSKVSDGSMKPDNINNQLSVLSSRAKFLKKNKIKPENTTLVKINYDNTDFTRYLTINEESMGEGIIRESNTMCDALVTSNFDHALLLPLADCVGAVIYDEATNVLMLSHLGRHSLEQFGGTKSIKYLVDNFNINPKNVKVWLSPAAGSENYPLTAFSGKSLHQVATEQLVASGVRVANITASTVDTTKDPSYFSHSQFLCGKRKVNGRFAVVAINEK